MEPSRNTPSVLGGSGVLGGLISCWAKKKGEEEGGEMGCVSYGAGGGSGARDGSGVVGCSTSTCTGPYAPI